MKDSRSAFALKLILGFPLVGIVWTYIMYFMSDSNNLNFKIAYWIGGVGVSLGIISLLSKSFFHVTWLIWNKIIFIFDKAITLITLPFFYFVIFSPFAIILRMFGKADMKNQKNNLQSYWKDIEKPTSARQYLRQF